MKIPLIVISDYPVIHLLELPQISQFRKIYLYRLMSMKFWLLIRIMLCPRLHALSNWLDLDCTPEQRSRANALFEFQDIFSPGLSRKQTVTHSIPLTDDISVSLPYRRIPPHQVGVVKHHLNELLTTGVTGYSTYNYVAPPVQKKTGDMRMCVAYRGLRTRR